MKSYKSEKTTRIVTRLFALMYEGNDVLTKVAEIILEKVEFYDRSLASWDKPAERFSSDEIEVGRKCCHAGLDMADSIVNELRILFLKEGEV